MKKRFIFILLLLINLFCAVQAQVKGPKIGYIDMEYILENISNYTEAQDQLDKKAEQWKLEVEQKNKEIDKLIETLNFERPLLTKELIEERENEIKILEKEGLEYQQKIFGANGILIQQKIALTKPVQDQVFATIQDIAESRKYDFIFDKSSDLTILFASKRFDISDLVIRMLGRTEKREQLNKAQQKELEQKQSAEDEELEDNSDLIEKQKILAEKKEAREKLIAERKQQQEAKKKENEELRLKMTEERKKVVEERNRIAAEKRAEKKSNAPLVENTTETVAIDSTKIKNEIRRKQQAEASQKALEDRKKNIEEIKQRQIDANQKAAEEHRKRIEEQRQREMERRQRMSDMLNKKNLE